MNRPAMCCARLDDFDWAVPDYDPDILLSGRDMEVRVTDVQVCGWDELLKPTQ